MNTEILKFTVGGELVTFTNPMLIEGNQRFTYNHIPKTTVLSIIGAIVGIKEQINIKNKVPNFYNELKDFEIAIVPKQMYFPKLNHTYTERTGSKNYNKKGETYLSSEYSLCNPSWDIYIKNSDNKYYEILKENIKNNKFYRKPYLGKSNYFARITNVEILNGTEIIFEDGMKIDSMFVNNNDFGEEDDDNNNNIFNSFYPTGYDSFEIEFKSGSKKSNKTIIENHIQYHEEILSICYKSLIQLKENDVQLLKCNNKYLYFI